MPYLVTCPNCGSKLKSGQPVLAGRALTCPQCKAGFTLSEAAPAVDLPAPAAPAPAPRPTPARPAPVPPPPTARSERPVPKRREEDEDDERPRSRRRDDEDDRPRRRRDEEEDERPKSRRRPVDDEDEDERPKSRRRRDEDEEEAEGERPRGRRRPEDEDDERPKSRRGRHDEDEEDRPKSRKARVADDDEDAVDSRRRSRGPAKKKGRRGPVLLLAGLAALFLLFAGGGAVMYFLDPFNLFGGSSSDMLAWAPSDSQALMYMDVEGMEKVSEMKSTLKGDVVDQVKLGLKPEDISAVLGAGRGPGDPDVNVIKLRSKADQEKLIAACGGKEATASGKKYYKSSGGGGLYFASDKLLVVTKTEAIMTALLQKENKVTISDDLKAVSKKGDGLMWMAAAGPAAEKGDLIGMMAGFGNLMGGFGVGGPAAKASPPKAKSTLLTVKASGSRGTGRFESTYDSPDSAKRVADDLKKIMDQAKGKSTDMESFDISTSGSTVTLTIVGPVKSGKAGFPGMPFGPGGGF